ncbi:hypothetical protein COBT_000899 [Conglomerata obtusa]
MSKEHEEMQYLSLIQTILDKGTKKEDRTGTGTLSITGAMMRFNLENNIFPLLTTKKVFFKGIVEELLFFIRGQTNNKILADKGINIWTGNSTKEFFLKNGITREEGDLGPIYGFQWRHYNAEYQTCHDNYENKGIDQLKNVIAEIKKNPSSRRLIVTSWNPLDIPKMALPPCHCLFQFIVRDKFLDCILYQRSGDVGLGIPFNIASYSLLTIMIAHVCNLEAGEFVHFIGDAHIYSNHVEQLKKQVVRIPNPFPKLIINKEIKDIEEFTLQDFDLLNYEPHPPIKMEMSV